MPTMTTDQALSHSKNPADLKGMTSRPYEGLLELRGTDRQKWVEGTIWSLPELGKTRCYHDRNHANLTDGIVVPIMGRNIRFRVVESHSEDLYEDMPVGFTIEWEITDAPESEYTAWEPTEFDDLTGEPLQYGPGGAYGVQFFGQPCYIQNKWYPSTDGKAPYHLFTVWSGWGDAGNENVLVSLDDDGLPTHFWFEASCH